MPNVISIEKIFCHKKFRFCSRHDYMWRRKIVEALLSDIDKALKINARHYLGTIIISKAEDGVFEIIDGQQRLMTIILVLRLFSTQLSDTEFNYRQYIETRVLGCLKDDFGRNTGFVAELFANQPVQYSTTGEDRLTDAYHCIIDKAKAIFIEGGDVLVKKWLNTLLLFEVIPYCIDRKGSNTLIT